MKSRYLDDLACRSVSIALGLLSMALVAGPSDNGTGPALFADEGGGQLAENEGALIQKMATCSPGPSWEARFLLRPGPPESPYQPLKYSNGQWYDSTFWTGPDWTRVGRHWHHPGENTPSVRCFVVPRDGSVTIRGRVYKLHQQGDGIRAMIRHNDREIWRTEIDGADGTGVEPDLKLEVQRGDSLRFIVHKRGQISCDTTFWDPRIIEADGTEHQASQSFGNRQGAGGWYYEMWREAPEPTPGPLVRGVRPDLSLFELAVTLNQPASLGNRDALPLLFVSDEQDRSGVVLAWDGSDPWTFHTATDDKGYLVLSLKRPLETDDSAAAGFSHVAMGGYEGPWTAALAVLRRWTAEDPATAGARVAAINALRQQYARLCEALRQAPDWDLFLMAQAEWRADDRIQETVESYSVAAREHFQRACLSLERLRAGASSAFLAREQELLDELSADIGADQPRALEDWRQLYLRVRLLTREIALANPLLDFERLFLCKRVPPSWSHLVAQYYGWRQRPGGGLCILTRPGYSLECLDIVQEQLPEGNYLEPKLSWDALRVIFSFVACSGETPPPGELPVNEQGGPERYFHLYEIGIDGSGLRQLTDGPYDDMMPAYLPDGGIAFVSTRRRSYSRCFGPEYSRRYDSYTVHRIQPDGNGLRILSVNDVSEWFPTVANTGHLLFARWDYIDRDAVTHQNLWAMRPDGTNPVAVWGNASPKPHCTFQAKPIPGSSKIVFIASAHHSITAGPVCVVDPTIDANSLDAVTRVTPGPFPEAESSNIPEYYESPWPLSEDCFLVAYSRDRLRFQGEHPENPNPDNALGIYLLDTAGNRELIYRDPQISSTNPTPLVPRPVPPVLPSTLPSDAPPQGEMVVSDVYQGLGDVPRGTIKELRIVQIFPKTTPVANSPRIGLAGEENARAILGTVPVEPDGSAHFLVPALKPLLFQALDADGFAYQTMRSTTYAQPGERVSCVGCHEPRMSAPPASLPLALQRPPSQIDPGALGGRPFSYVQVVQPVLDAHCVRCHGGERTDGDLDLTGTPQDGFTRSYWSLCGKDQDWRSQSAEAGGEPPMVPRFWQRNQIQLTTPGGRIGALGSRLMRLLRQGHEDVRLSPDELRRLAAWIDMNAVFYGAYDAESQARELTGQRIGMPEIQ